MVPSGASHVGSMTFDALARMPRVRSPTSQSSLAQPGRPGAVAQSMRRTEPSGRTRSWWPAATSTGSHEIHDPGLTSAPRTVPASSWVPHFASQSRWPGPLSVAQRVLPERLAQDVQRRLPGVGEDVDPLEEVAVGRDSAGSCPGPPIPTAPVPSSRSAVGPAAHDGGDPPDVGEVRHRCGRPSRPGGRRRRCRRRWRWAPRLPAVMAAIQRSASSRSSSTPIRWADSTIDASASSGVRDSAHGSAAHASMGPHAGWLSIWARCRRPE